MNFIDSLKALVRGLFQMWWNLKSLKAAKRLGMEFDKQKKSHILSLKVDPTDDDNPNKSEYSRNRHRTVATGYPDIIFVKSKENVWLVDSRSVEGSLETDVFDDVSKKLIRIFQESSCADALTTDKVTCVYDFDVYVLTVIK